MVRFPDRFIYRASELNALQYGMILHCSESPDRHQENGADED